MEWRKKVLQYSVIGVIALLICFCILMFLAYIFLDDKITDYGAFGDFVNGVSAPIIGILGSLLVGYSLIKQVEANRRLEVINKAQLLLNGLEAINIVLKDINAELTKVEFSISSMFTYYGSEGVSMFVKFYDKQINKNEYLQNNARSIIKFSYCIDNFSDATNLFITFNQVNKNPIYLHYFNKFSRENIASIDALIKFLDTLSDKQKGPDLIYAESRLSLARFRIEEAYHELSFTKV